MGDEEIDPYIEETKILAGMSKEDRIAYVTDIIEYLRSRAKWILEAKNVAGIAKRASKVSDGFTERGEELMICLLYSIKGDFRVAWMRLLGTIAGMKETQDSHVS